MFAYITTRCTVESVVLTSDIPQYIGSHSTENRPISCWYIQTERGEFGDVDVFSTQTDDQTVHVVYALASLCYSIHERQSNSCRAFLLKYEDHMSPLLMLHLLSSRARWWYHLPGRYTCCLSTVSDANYLPCPLDVRFGR